jgi:tetratricopeptide (TPR) repeat protein
MSSARPGDSSAESAFRSYLRLRGAGETEQANEFLDQLAPGVRAEFLLILADYEALAASSAPAAPIAAAPAPPRLGDFELLHELGRGGMGTVWEARQRSLDRRVAVKLLHPHLGLSDRWLERFQREGQVAGRMTHPGIVTVHSVGEQDGTHFIVQELVTGGRNLAQWIAEMQALKPAPADAFDRIARIFAKAAEALHAAHEMGIVHRDVKPANILLAPDDEPKIADFGLASLAAEADLARTGEYVGTPSYMSPEQVAARRLPLDRRTDVFALGASLYEALTFRVPFPGDTREQVVQKILFEDPIEPQRLRSRVPRDLAIICLKALQKNPALRYQSAGDVAADLRRFLAREPILARPPSWLSRVWMFAQRHPARAVGGAAAALTFLLVAYLYADARAESRRADAAAANALRQEEIARRTESFLLGLFSASTPEARGGETLTLKDVLDRGAQQVRDEPSADLEVNAAMMMAIGSAYFQLGDYEKAEPLLADAVNLRLRAAGTEDQRTLQSMNKLANLLNAQARYPEAERWYLLAQEGHVRLYGAGSPEERENRGNLGYLYWRSNRLDEAEPLLRESLAGTIALYGADSSEVVAMQGNFASLLVKQGKLAEAEPMLEAVVAARRVDPGELSPAFLAPYQMLAETKEGLGKAEEAEPIFRENLRLCRQVYGDEHPVTAGAWHSLGLFLAGQKRDAEALDPLQSALKIRQAKLRAGHPSLLVTLSSLVNVLHRLGRDAEAQPLAEELIRLTPENDPKREERLRLADAVRG